MASVPPPARVRSPGMRRTVAVTVPDREQFIPVPNALQGAGEILKLVRDHVHHVAFTLQPAAAPEHSSPKDNWRWRSNTVDQTTKLAMPVSSSIVTKMTPVIFTRPEEFEAWLAAPVEEALVLQRPLPAELLKIVASDSTKDEGPVALAV